MELAIETLWSAGACGAVPWVFETRGVEGGWSGQGGVELNYVSEASNRNIWYEIKKPIGSIGLHIFTYIYHPNIN